MTVGELLKKATSIFKEGNNVKTPAREAGVILSHLIKCDKIFIYTNADLNIDEVKAKEYIETVFLRAKGFPLQYITGHQEFMSLDFFVNPDVLIPRQDTEILVETVLEQIKGLHKTHIHILDIGTGSGCIGVSLAYYLPLSRVAAIDISKKALEVGRINAERMGVHSRVTFLESNLFERLEKGKLFDVIVSNPPYIPSSHISGLQIEVREYEPLNALDGGEDGLEFYRSIIKDAGRFLNPRGILAVEVGYNQAGDVAELMSLEFTDITIVKDLSKIDRVVSGRLK
ncbi:MAG: peptide chain release factor N(5)-glutamine methyltransferase [Clostridia bacterium]|nr:peptide chain release factor N(5)-glutamine methyltransferase [Clostridia bacterium]